MTRLVGFWNLLIVGFLVSGCASGGPKGSEILTGSIAPNTSRLVLYRVSPLGMAIQPNYMLNGKAVAPTQPSGFVVCDIAPGTYTVSIDNLSADMSLTGGTDKTSVKLTPGQTTYLKAEPQFGLIVGVITLSHVTPPQGQQDTASLSKIEGSCV